MLYVRHCGGVGVGEILKKGGRHCGGADVSEILKIVYLGSIRSQNERELVVESLSSRLRLKGRPWKYVAKRIPWCSSCVHVHAVQDPWHHVGFARFQIGDRRIRVPHH